MLLHLIPELPSNSGTLVPLYSCETGSKWFGALALASQLLDAQDSSPGPSEVKSSALLSLLH